MHKFNMKNRWISLIFLLATVSYGVTIVRYVNTAAALGGDGTTNNTTGGTRAYHSLFEWEANEQQDLTDAGGDIMRVYCEGTAQDDSGDGTGNGRVLINGWTTGEASFIHILTTQANRFDGTWDTGKYRLVLDGDNSTPALAIAEDWVVIEGIQVAHTGGFNSTHAIKVNGHSGLVSIIECLVNSSNSDSRNGYHLDGKTYLRNCIAQNMGDVGFFLDDGADNSLIYNCSAIDNGAIGFQQYWSNSTWINNLAYGNGGTDFVETGTATMTLTYSASEDASADDQGGAGNRINQTFSFVDYAGEDFHLTSSDGGARDFGTDLSSATWAFDIDIDSVVRGAGGDWDIGADEYGTLSSTVIRYVNTAAPMGGDGTTNTTNGDADDAYHSLLEWENEEQRDLTTGPDIMLVYCEGTAVDDSGVVTIDGWTTASDAYIHILTSQANRHDGKWNTSQYRLEVTNTWGMDIREDYVRVEGIQVKYTYNSSGATRGGITTASAGTTTGSDLQ